MGVVTGEVLYFTASPEAQREFKSAADELLGALLSGRNRAANFYQANPTKAEVFFARLADGICKHKQVPMYVLRERLTQGKITRRRWTNMELFSMTIRAWNAHYRSRKITMLRLKTKADGGSKEIEIPSIQGLPS